MRVDSCELPLFAIPLCQLLPSHLGPPKPMLSNNLYVKGCLDCTFGAFHVSIPAEPSLFQYGVSLMCSIKPYELTQTNSKGQARPPHKFVHLKQGYLLLLTLCFLEGLDIKTFKVTGITFRESKSAIFIFYTLLSVGQLLKKRICSS